MTNYQLAKKELKEIAKQAKMEHPTDKPMVRQIINDNCYFLSKQYNLTDYQFNLLDYYACDLHP